MLQTDMAIVVYTEDKKKRYCLAKGDYVKLCGMNAIGPHNIIAEGRIGRIDTTDMAIDIETDMAKLGIAYIDYRHIEEIYIHIPASKTIDTIQSDYFISDEERLIFILLDLDANIQEKLLARPVIIDSYTFKAYTNWYKLITLILKNSEHPRAADALKCFIRNHTFYYSEGN